MKTMFGYTGWTLAIAGAVVLLGGCSQLSAPSVMPPSSGQGPASGQGAGSAVRELNKKSWMSPEAKNEDLIYVSNVRTNSVGVYAYRGRKLVGTLNGINAPYGLCSDTSGNVWVVAWGTSTIVEYAHAGTKPLKTLSDDDSEASLFDCSVDPLTGNLAVTDWGYNWYQGYVLIYRGATGTPTEYNGERLWYYYGCSYDNKGNLYADGWDAYLWDNFSLAKLPRGGKSFHRIHLQPQINPPMLGGVQWDGKYVAVGNLDSVWEYSIKGHWGHVAGYTSLTDHWPVGLFWIRTMPNGNRAIVAPDYAGSPYAVQYWKYPEGGIPNTTVKAGLDNPFGVTVSVKPK